MNGGKNIVWLASYPKSGNTWFRAFLTALQQDGAVDINRLNVSGIFSSKERFVQITDTDPDELTEPEVLQARHEMYRYLSDQAGGQKRFVKIHDAFTYGATDVPVVPEAVTHCAVYFVRNPLDVAVSFANHCNHTVSENIEQYMNNDEGVLAAKPTANQFAQRLLNWSNHVRSWLERPKFPVHVLRYEDMLTDTFQTFSDVVMKLGLEHSEMEIRKAIEASSFDALRRQEERHGFREKMPDSPRFFNKGIAGNWKHVLTEEQVERIRASHGEMMGVMNYEL